MPRIEYRVVRVVGMLLMPFILLFALYVLLHGEYGPGGGFQAGVIFATGIVLYALLFGREAAQRVLPMGLLLRLMPAGVLLYAGVGIGNMALGGSFLDYSTLAPNDPAGGQHLGILLIEIGVGITVAAVVTAMFYALAGRGER